MEMTVNQLQDLIKQTVGDILAQQKSRGAGEGEDHVEGGTQIADDILRQAAAEREERARKGMKPGSLAAQIVRAAAAGKGSTDASIGWAKKHYGEKSDVVKALSANVADEGGFLVREGVSNEVIELLTPRTVVRQAQPRTLQMGAASFLIPRVTGGAVAGYIGENGRISTTGFKVGQLRMTLRKLAALVPISNDFLRYASPGSDTLVRDDLVGAIARREDASFLLGDGQQETPIGIRNHVPTAHILDAQTSPDLAKVTADCRDMLLTLMEANCAMEKPAWFMPARPYMYLRTVRDANGNFAFKDEIDRGMFWNFPIFWTNQMPNNLNLLGSSNECEIILADMADVILGEGTGLLVDSSNQAAYHDGTSVVAAFSQDQTVVRVIEEHDIALRHPESAVVMQKVLWGN